MVALLLVIVESVLLMEDREEIIKLIKEAISSTSYDWENLNVITQRILRNLENANFKIVKKMSIGGSIG